MGTRLAIISDTHMPKGGRRLPEGCVRRLRDADVIVHAGDLATLEVLGEIQQLGPRVVAVHGNVDDAATRAALPETVAFTVEGRTVAVTHDGGPSKGRLRRLAARFPEADLVVFGHSHIPLHETDPATGAQILNPGSPTERRRAPRHTMAIATVTPAAVAVELVALD